MARPTASRRDAPYAPRAGLRSALPHIEVHPLAQVTRIDHSPLEDRLEQANARALDAWLRGGRTV
jgi:hypothetical protein